MFLPRKTEELLQLLHTYHDIKTTDELIVGIGRLVHWYRPIVVYTIGKYKFLFLLPKLPVSGKSRCACNFAFECVFVLSTLCSPSSMLEPTDNNHSLNI